MRALDLSDYDIIYIGNSKGYLIAAELIVHSPQFAKYEINVLMPLSALLAFSLEFALKAYLLNYSVNNRDLKRPDVRHNLASLLSMAEARGLKLDKNLE